jgi:hypothetical protein
MSDIDRITACTETPFTLEIRMSIDNPAFGALAAEHRLLNPVFLGTTRKPGRAGFRGEIALKFAQQLSDEARPPELKADQVMMVGDAGAPGITFLACYLHSFESLKVLADVLGEGLLPDGKYFAFCNNIDLSTRYQCAYGGATFHILPIDEATVYNELLELLRVEKNELKKLDTAGKLDRVADAAATFSDSFPAISYAQGLEVMGPVRNALENRPV